MLLKRLTASRNDARYRGVVKDDGVWWARMIGRDRKYLGRASHALEKVLERADILSPL